MRTPLGQGAQGRLDFLPRHGEQHVAQTRRLLDGRRRGASAELSRLAGKSAGTASTAQDNLMSTGKRLARNRKRNLTCSDRPNPHCSVLSMLRENAGSTILAGCSAMLWLDALFFAPRLQL